jgi:UDP-N-acetylmuramate: L-alanyl-gamma-D-glutamyl-meso-diaminopimelate ligase
MGALASLLQDQGYVVTGSDGPLYPPMSTFLAERKVRVVEGYRAENILGESWGFEKGRFPDLVVIGNAISRTNLEAQAVESHALKKMSFAAALAEFCIQDRRSFVVAGTHGKTTTTSILAWCLESLGRHPGFFIGGIPLNFSQGCRVGDGKVFVTEGDEYDTAYWDKGSKFLHYRPSWVLCTGVEFDHADIFADVDAIESSFEKLIKVTREGWVLVDDQTAPRADSVARLAKAATAQGISLVRYGLSADSSFRLLSTKSTQHPQAPSQARGTQMTIQTPTLGTIELWSPMTGDHNALNVVGVIAVLLSSGEARTVADLQKALLGFRGVKRRQEEVFVGSGLTVIDDFAHHPTAIRETVKAICARYPQAKVAAFFEPRSATSARNILAKEFAEAFDDSTAVFLVSPTKTNVPLEERLDVRALVSEISHRPAMAGKTCVATQTIPELATAFGEWRKTVPSSQPVVALVMSNGPFGGLHGILSGQPR